MKHFTKTISLLVVLLAFGCKSNSQQAEKAQAPINTSEITWQPDITQALADAKAQGKLLFVECYSPTCPYCQALEPFFKNTEVATKYNTNFINYKLDVGEAEQVKFLNARNIWLPSFPMFLYFDSDGNLVHQSGADPNVESINGNADDALDEDTRADSYPKRFAAGERSIEFLTDYANYAKVIKDTAATTTAAEELFKIYPKDKLGTKESWELTKKAVNDVDNGFAEYWLKNVSKAAAIEAENGHPGTEQNTLQGIIQNSLYSSKAKDYSIEKINRIKQYMTSTGAGQYVDGATWELESKALIRDGKGAQALSVGQKMVDKLKTNGSALVYITRVFVDNFKDNSFIPTAKKWMATALPTINQDNVKAEYHYEMARLHQKAGDLTAAKADAATAMELTRKIGGKPEKFQKLIDSLN
ncbi:thioredoxin family protein [Jiulongibacter sediminis]|uniref:thioredoxin family protein n=1 Tax=Jiulongibacter sediminis TaxID=1605367 RepID=UPI0026ED1848|nr:thioredoxin family protein [Jiulongibacter sediminis]